MIEPKALNRGLLLWGALLIVAASLFAGQIAAQFSLATRVAPEFAGLQKLILMDSILPRSAMAILCGAALGFSGVLLQRVLRNPLAEPSTLGISAGAQLAMAIAMLYFPALMEGGREAVALAGGLIAVALILSLTWQRGLEPVSVVLAGMMVSLTATAASAALILANGEYLFSLFIWGGGSLAQQSWVPVSGIIWKILLACAASIVLLRPLSILGLDDASAKNLGVALQGTRFLVIGLAVWLATSVTAEVGIIGFVGLAAPALARLTGAALRHGECWRPPAGWRECSCFGWRMGLCSWRPAPAASVFQQVLRQHCLEVHCFFGCCRDCACLNGLRSMPNLRHPRAHAGQHGRLPCLSSSRVWLPGSHSCWGAARKAG